MATNTFNVTLVRSNFTATIAAAPSPVTVGIGTYTINVNPSPQVVVTATQQINNIEIVENGIINILSPSMGTVDEFDGNGSTTTFRLSKALPNSGDFLEVVVGGVVQTPGISYTTSTINTIYTSTTDIIFSQAPPAGTSNITARYYSILVAEQIAGPQGTSGPQGPRGIQGPSLGPQGVQGTQGIQGRSGSQGTQGLSGYNGGQGVQGPQGVQGVQGVQGASVTWDSLPGRKTTNQVIIGNSGVGGGQYAITIGSIAGTDGTGDYSVAVGFDAGGASASGAIGIGYEAGSLAGTNAVAIGYNAGRLRQGNYAIAIGEAAGGGQQYLHPEYGGQGQHAIAIGRNAGLSTQTSYAIALGDGAGQWHQGANSIAIGQNAGYNNQVANSVVIDATNSSLSPTNSGLYIKPIRVTNVIPSGFYKMYYNPTTGELIAVT